MCPWLWRESFEQAVVSQDQEQSLSAGVRKALQLFIAVNRQEPTNAA
jgi:hypothetical protein